MTLGVGIIGCGVIGARRAGALAGARLIACADANLDRAIALASATGAKLARDWREILDHDGVDAVVVATTNEALAEIAAAAIQAGKHVLLEKPGGRSVAEIERLIALERTHDVRVRAGFNHRYHPALIKARELVDAGAVGELMFVRGRYGHGGRLGYEKEWRANPALSGGGELIDQGVHLIDLARWFLGDFTGVDGVARTFFWDMPVDDNAFMTLTTSARRIAFLHVSCTEWKNIFSFEIYGRTGKIQIEGLGGSYGIERITHYRMLPEMGPPETTAWEYPRNDRSWELEMAELIDDIAQRRRPAANLDDARAALEVVETIYRSSGYGR